MKKQIVFIGLNDGEARRQLVETEKAVDYVKKAFVDIIGGATLSLATGIFTHDDGETVVENTIRVEVYDASAEAVRAVAELCKIEFNQKSVLIEESEVQTSFI